MIARLFPADYHGFYIDIGAAHPKYLSVTCHFYNHGWSGINVEPSLRFYPLLCEARPNDTNLNCAIGHKTGQATFYEFTQFAENSTLERDVADKIAKTGHLSTTHEVEVMRLEELCDRYVKERAIDFMKIDVEGGEVGVLEGADWAKYRPRLLIVEATVVNSREENSATWERILIDADYHKVWFDGLNNFYLRDEDFELRHAFRLPPNIFDCFETVELVSLRQVATSLRAQLTDREAELTAIKLTGASLQRLKALENERSAMLSSRSWRMTAPLRALSIRARCVVNLLRDRILL